MSTAASMPSRYAPPGVVLRAVMALLAAAALGLSLMLLFSSLGRAGVLVGCEPGSGCDHVLTSRWSVVLGVPVSALAVVTYLGVLAALLHIGPGASYRRQHGAWLVLIGLAVWIIAAAVWFTAVQWWWLDEWCKYCLAVHGLGVVLAVMILFYAPIGRVRVEAHEPADPVMIRPALAAVLDVALLIGLQTGFPPAPPEAVTRTINSDTGPGPDRVVTFYKGTVALRPHELPILGSPDAEHILVSLVDYTCPYCRQMHQYLQQARQRYGHQIAVVILPIALKDDCFDADERSEPRHTASHDLARLALRVWQAAPQAFETFEEQLFAPPKPPTPAEAQQLARRWLDDAAADDDWPDQQIARNLTFYRLTGNGVLPKIFVRSVVFQGRAESAEALFALLEKELGIVPLTGPSSE